MEELNNKHIVYDFLEKHGIQYEKYEHPPIPTIEEAMKYWKDIDATHCKNLFFRNHKGNRHYMVILHHKQKLGIHELEKKLKQGKLSFASEKRMIKYLKTLGGSLSLFGLINDTENHTCLFLDENLKEAEKLSFHPNNNTETLVITKEGFQKLLEAMGNPYEFLKLY